MTIGIIIALLTLIAFIVPFIYSFIQSRKMVKEGFKESRDLTTSPKS